MTNNVSVKHVHTFNIENPKNNFCSQVSKSIFFGGRGWTQRLYYWLHLGKKKGLISGACSLYVS